MGFDQVLKHNAEHGTSSQSDFSLNGQRPIWPDLVPSNECFQNGTCPSSVDRYNTKTLEEKGWLHRFSLHDLSKNEDRSKSDDLYRFSGPERASNRVEHVLSLEEYETRIKGLEARLAAQTEKLEKLIAQVSHESTDNGAYSNRPTNLPKPADGAHYVFDRNGNGQLVGPQGEHQYNLINGERVWLKTDRSSSSDYTPPVRSGCTNGSCGSCSSCRPRPRLFR